MVITLELESETPLYEQLRNQIVIGIATGKLEQHEKLPTVRQLAEDLGINTMTVNKAYGMLKQEGYIVIDRRHGAKVSVTKQLNDDQLVRLSTQLELIIAEATLLGVESSSFHQLCKDIFSKMHYRANLQE